MTQEPRWSRQSIVYLTKSVQHKPSVPCHDSEGDPMETKCYTAEEVAELLRVGRTKVFELIKTGQLGSVKIGGNRRVLPKQLDEFLSQLVEEVA
jgi:excisionase family DNA binding protein